MQLETVNKLYLELSQFATAKTARELELEKQFADLAWIVRDGMAGVAEPMQSGRFAITLTTVVTIDGDLWKKIANVPAQ